MKAGEWYNRHMPSFVALDIETTGLDPRSDAIIEIGAVRFSGNRVESEWTTLVNPGKPVPSFITQLTGISNEMVKNAPPIKAVINTLADFVGSDPVVGHNVRFDLSFLQQHKILKENPALDTYELASVLIPTASRYNLGALGQRMGVILPATHRALDDARVTHAIFVQLYEMGLALPTGLINEFVRLSELFEWGARWTFGQILRARLKQPVSKRAAGSHRTDSGPIFQERDLFLPPLLKNTRMLPLDSNEAAGLLTQEGPFSQFFNQYEFRNQQIEMTRAVARAFSTSTHLLVEAGTGTGKSFAYLIPAALWAVKNNARVVISTNTINLQDQLIKKDIPDLCRALNLNLNVAVLKGRSNYLCPRRLEALRQRGPGTVDEMRVLAKLLVWMQSSDTGDRGEINLNGPAERDVWMRLSAEDEGCKAETCQVRGEGGCPFYRARQFAQSAHLLVVNHALLLADVASGNRVLPEYDYLIVDEGHHMEAATTSALSFRVTQGDVMRLLRELGGPANGILGYLLNLMEEIMRPAQLAAYDQGIHRAADLLFRLEHLFRGFYSVVDEFMTEQRDGRAISGYGQQERVTESTRGLPVWTNVELAWVEVHDTIDLLLTLLTDLYRTGAEAIREQPDQQELEDGLDSLSDAAGRLARIDASLQSIVSTPTKEYIYWVEIQPGNNLLALNMAPLHIGSLMKKYIWDEKASVILTSATLTTNEGFDYLRGRLNAEDAHELQLGSPFDYESAAMLYLANDIPEPSDVNGFQRAIEQALIRLARATGGKLLALFTSYAQLRRTSTVITPRLNEAGIIVYEQGEGASTSTLLETFREADKAVLLGTRSFWEGVDIPGDALSVLVIVKLPFDVPTEPIVAARSETFENPFLEYQIPEAILRFRQGFGRLIRTQFDRGVVAILDRRIITKSYGKAFLESLPACQVHIGSVQELPQAAARWLNL